MKKQIRLTPRGELLVAVLAILGFLVLMGVAGSLDLAYNDLPNDQ